MAALDDLYSQIPTSDIATKLGADQGEVDKAVHTLVPVLLSGLQHTSQDPEHASKIEDAASGHAARGLLDAGGGVDHVDENDGHQAVATLFGGKDTNEVATALAGGGAGNSELLKQLLPIILPIVLAYIGKQLNSGGAAETPPRSNAAPVAGWATSWAVSWAAVTTSRWAAFSAACWAVRAVASATFSAACSVVRNNLCHNRIELRRAVSVALATNGFQVP